MKVRQDKKLIGDVWQSGERQGQMRWYASARVRSGYVWRFLPLGRFANKKLAIMAVKEAQADQVK